jgi:hypothetical protein
LAAEREDKFAIAENDGDQIAEIVRDVSGDLPECHERLHLQQTALEVGGVAAGRVARVALESLEQVLGGRGRFASRRRGGAWWRRQRDQWERRQSLPRRV